MISCSYYGAVPRARCLVLFTWIRALRLTEEWERGADGWARGVPRQHARCCAPLRVARAAVLFCVCFVLAPVYCRSSVASGSSCGLSCRVTWLVLAVHAASAARRSGLGAEREPAARSGVGRLARARTGTRARRALAACAWRVWARCRDDRRRPRRPGSGGAAAGGGADVHILNYRLVALNLLRSRRTLQRSSSHLLTCTIRR